jgi:hypothetical protein
MNVWPVLTLLTLIALIVVMSAASSGASWTLRGPGFSVVLPGVPIH